MKSNVCATRGFLTTDLDRRGLNRGFDTCSSPFQRKMGRSNPIVTNLQDLRRPAEDVVADALRWMAAQPAHSSRPSAFHPISSSWKKGLWMNWK
jgi:hypothetical protein